MGKYAIKIPQINYTWQLFLRGLQCNIQEAVFGKMGDKRMAPVLWASWGGWILIMARCEPLSRVEFNKVDIEKFHPLGVSECCYNGIFNVPCEFKQCSFGWYKFDGVHNIVVAVDYGS